MRMQNNKKKLNEFSLLSSDFGVYFDTVFSSNFSTVCSRASQIDTFANKFLSRCLIVVTFCFDAFFLKEKFPNFYEIRKREVAKPQKRFDF